MLSAQTADRFFSVCSIVSHQPLLAGRLFLSARPNVPCRRFHTTPPKKKTGRRTSVDLATPPDGRFYIIIELLNFLRFKPTNVQPNTQNRIPRTLFGFRGFCSAPAGIILLVAYLFKGAYTNMVCCPGFQIADPLHFGTVWYRNAPGFLKVAFQTVLYLITAAFFFQRRPRNCDLFACTF